MKTNAAYELITNQIIQSMEAGEVPWRKPWTSTAPRNLFSGKAYRGINNWLLSMVSTQYPVFATFNQFKSHGAVIKKGSKSVPVFFFTKLTKEEELKDGSKKEKHIPMIRQYNVFTVEQVDNLDLSQFVDQKEDFTPNMEAQTLVDSFLENVDGLSLDHHGNDRAYYSPKHDSISVPAKTYFHSSHDYYSTIFHEIGHSTGHEKRLNRDGIAKITSHARGEAYSFEELVAELTAAYLCSLTGIDNQVKVDQSAAYIKSWLKVLKDDKALIWKAAAQAQKAVDFILETANLDQVSNEEEAPF